MTTDREMIEGACKTWGLSIDSWQDDEDEGLQAVLAEMWQVIEENEDIGLYGDDEGIVKACVVGSEKYHNRQVKFYFTPDGFDNGVECQPGSNVEIC